MRPPSAIAIVLFAAFATTVQAQQLVPAELVAPGQSHMLNAEVLSALPTQEATSSFLSSKGIIAAQYKGVLLWDVLSDNDVMGDDAKLALRHSVLVTASDGHQVVFSVGEIAPDFGDRPVMIAYERDGKPLERLQMVSPGDTRGARHVKDVIRLEYR